MDKNQLYDEIQRLRAENEQLKHTMVELNAGRQAEEAIDMAALNYRLLVEASHDIIFTADAEGVIGFASKAWEKILGHPADDIPGHSFRDFLHPDHHETAIAYLTQLASNGNIHHDIEYMVRHVDGSWRWHRTHANPLFSDQGEFTGLVGIARDITDYKMAVQELNRTNLLFGNISDNMFDTVIVTDLGATITYCSGSVRNSGYSPEEIVGRNALELVHPDDLKRISDELDTFFDQTGVRRAEVRYRLANGEYHWFEVIGKPVKDAFGTEGHFFIFSGRNINDRKLAEEALLKREEEYRQLSATFRLMTDTMTDLIWAKDLDKKYLFANRAICEKLLMAANTDEPIGKTDMFFALRERNKYPDNPDWHTFGELCRDSDGITLQEMRPMQFDEFGNVEGKMLYLDVQKAPLYNDRGELIGVVGSARDVTESKVAEKLLKEANETYQGIFNALTEAIYILDDSGTFIDVNLGAEKMYGYSRQELIGKSPLDVAAPGLNELDQILSEMGKTKSDGTVSSFEFWACRKNGEVFPKAVIVNKGTYFGKEVLIATARDITAQKQWEAALVQYQKRMQLASDAARFGVWEYDVVNNVLSWDDAMLRIYGIRREEFGDSYQTFLNLIHPSDVEELRKNERKVLLDGNEFQSEFRIIRPDGQTRYIYAAAAVERNADKQPVRVTGINSDITRRKLEERQLLESETKLETILGNSYEKIWAVDKDYKVLYINHGFIEDYQKIFGITLAKGSDIFSGAGNEIREKWRNRYDRVLEGETLSFVEKIGVHGSDIFIDLVMQPIAIGGTVIGVSCCGKDISVKVAADKQAAYEAELRNLLVELSTRFINLPLQHMADAFNASLQRIGKFVDADRAYIFEYDFLNNVASNTFEWCNEGITPYIGQLQHIPLHDFRQYIDVHRRGEVVHISNISEVSNPALYAVMEMQQVMSVLALPLIRNGECMGFIGFDMVQHAHVFTPQEQQLLQVYAQLIVNLRERGDKEEALLIAIEQANTQRAKTEAVIENTTDNIWAIDSGYNLLYINDNLKQEYLRAFNTELKTGDNKLEKVPDAIRDFWKTNYDRALNREHFTFEQAVPTINGTTYVQVSMNPILVGNQVIGVSCFGRNITEQKIAEAQLLEAKNRAETSEEKLRLMIKNSNDSFVLLNANAEIFFISDAASRDTGYPTEELTGPMTRLIHPDDLSRVMEDFTRILNDENVLGRVRYRHIHKTRGYAWFEAVGQNFLSNPSINAIVVNVRNIDYIIESEEELIRAKDRAEESDRLKSAFLANMSHEIRTPMNGILGFAELLKEPELTGDQQNEYIQIIEKSGKRMLGIINDIIDISKIESGLMNLDIKPSNINEQTDYIYTFFKPEAQAKNLTLRINKTLSSIESVIFTDREKLYAILTNLVKNAIKYTHTGTIEMGYRRAGEFIEFYVSDTGIGIPSDRHHAIFERFVQADPVDRQAHQGAGLGLSITRAYVEMLGGSIWVESSPGEGSTFRFTLPVNNSKEYTEGSNSVPQTETGGLSKPVDANLVILIAEDDDTSRRLLKALVKPYSGRLIEAKSGTEAVEACRLDHEVNLVLMDIKLPEMDGYEATRQIRLFNKDLVIIAQTAYGLSGDREKALGAGCNDYIAKPIDKNKLDTLLARWFGKSG